MGSVRSLSPPRVVPYVALGEFYALPSDRISGQVGCQVDHGRRCVLPSHLCQPRYRYPRRGPFSIGLLVLLWGYAGAVTLSLWR